MCIQPQVQQSGSIPVNDHRQLGEPNSCTLIGFISQLVHSYVHHLCSIQIKAQSQLLRASTCTSMFHLFLSLSWTVLGVCEALNKDLITCHVYYIRISLIPSHCAVLKQTFSISSVQLKMPRVHIHLYLNYLWLTCNELHVKTICVVREICSYVCRHCSSCGFMRYKIHQQITSLFFKQEMFQHIYCKSLPCIYCIQVRTYNYV